MTEPDPVRVLVEALPYQARRLLLFKQWGEWAPTGYVGLGTSNDLRRVGKKAAGRELDGRTWDEYPRKQED